MKVDFKISKTTKKEKIQGIIAYGIIAICVFIYFKFFR
ncbi:hypothetical protein HMPREF9629_00707 [Peptoanaerobacter stomatis]|uniref:Uncharacterized protein n=1 Tax=Peptoanaerobacter stomatis TaxID=796937 RepID=G9X2V0_9FIRM|nr:hypothetical protein HMPREF9629_00707 [Peptoanaerobacter stomatis]